jgi:hypothetical protein
MFGLSSRIQVPRPWEEDTERTPRQVVPRPIQRPHPPLWFAASNLETSSVRGSRASACSGVTCYTHAEVKPHVEAYRGSDPYRDTDWSFHQQPCWRVRHRLRAR